MTMKPIDELCNRHHHKVVPLSTAEARVTTSDNYHVLKATNRYKNGSGEVVPTDQLCSHSRAVWYLLANCFKYSLANCIPAREHCQVLRGDLLIVYRGCVFTEMDMEVSGTPYI